MVIILRRSLMKKSLVFAGMMLAALALSASAAEMPGPEPNKQTLFAFAKTNDAVSLVALAPNETAGNMQSSGFMIVTGLALDKKPRYIDLSDLKPIFGSLAPKRLGSTTFASLTNPRELHPEGYLKM